MAGLFVTATGTGVGKTHVTATLLRQARAKGIMARALKPILSGTEDSAPTDSAILLGAMELPVTPENFAGITHWAFRAPLSPDMAAARENRNIDFAALTRFCREEINRDSGPVLIEGVGGAFVPLGGGKTVADWIRALHIPAIVVAGTYLGTISHSLSTLLALRAAGIELRALVLSESPGAPVSPEETARSLRSHMDLPIFIVPRDGDADLLPLLDGL